MNNIIKLNQLLIIMNKASQVQMLKSKVLNFINIRLINLFKIIVVGLLLSSLIKHFLFVFLMGMVDPKWLPIVLNDFKGCFIFWFRTTYIRLNISTIRNGY